MLKVCYLLKILTRAACSHTEIARVEHIMDTEVWTLWSPGVCSSGCSAHPADPAGTLRPPGSLLTALLLFHTLE